MTVLRWRLPVRLDESCSPSGAAPAAITSQICHRLWQPAMNNLYEYSSIACVAQPTVCLHSVRLNQLSKLFPWPWNLWSGLSWLVTGWCEPWRWQRTGNCRSVIAAAWDDRTADSADGVRVQPQDDFCGGAVSKCRFRLRWHLGPNCGNWISLASFPLCSFWDKITLWCQKPFLFNSVSTCPDSSLLG